ncbi:S-adenosyl-L-methionine-dependent methyltransferase [Russula emetica]|nr:S-adenosyl-L-methionine-dependent methyltransferase [Russula emetica]
MTMTDSRVKPQQQHSIDDTNSNSTLGQHHQHHHYQHHHHVDGSTLASASASTQSHDQNQLEAANIAHFDALGHDFDKQNPFSAEFADRLSRALRRLSRSRSADSSSSSSDNVISSLVLDEDTTSVLDYACGSGQISRALAPYVAQLVGVDISPRMVEVYNTRASTQGLEPHEMRAVSSLAELQQQQRFDLAVCSMAYHHFPSVEQVTRDIVEYLKPSGILAVADIAARVHAAADGDGDGDKVNESESEAPSIIPAEYEHLVSHTRGFTEEYMRTLFEGAGLVNFTFDQFTSAKWHGRDIDFFLATGTKPAQF